MSTRLSDTLTIGGKPVTSIVTKSVQLDIASTGRAKFEIVTEEVPSGLVELHLGYTLDNMVPYFLGVIESKHQANGRWYLTCRELLGALSFTAPLAVRHATIKAVLDELAKLGVEFVTPENAGYLNKTIPAFYHSGIGIEALKQIGKAWGISDFIFQQRPDGKIFVGSWHDSRWPLAAINDFPEHTITAKSSTTGELIAIPKLRPGIQINGRNITETTLINDRMHIRWSNKPLNA
ncbi:hypothetical protein [Pseudoalteromonas sp. BSi20495]|uniref:hypothetical protein n=1 Tax=Pseudoalteromonas sp. BSi20495 TaxID=386429 RepID=UPI000231565F|nr:hypothetical protein [Pseudoalteromonas sp. BSi20495]GAA79223.1 hypothetical protein P20495_1721 [Pseudoalteromonas sp. BSi20495]